MASMKLTRRNNWCHVRLERNVSVRSSTSGFERTYPQNLCTVFLISGLVHIGGEYMMLGRLGLGAFRFFLLQGLAISIETIVSNVLSLSGSSPRKAALSTLKLRTRIVGYVWVLLWFWWSLPLMVDPGIPAGTYGPHRGLTFERLSKLTVNAYHRSAMDV